MMETRNCMAYDESAGLNPHETLMIPVPVMLDKRLTRGDLTVFGAVSYFAREFGYCDQSRAHIGDVTGVAVKGVGKSLRKLLTLGYIQAQYIENGDEAYFIEGMTRRPARTVWEDRPAKVLEFPGKRGAE